MDQGDNYKTLKHIRFENMYKIIKVFTTLTIKNTKKDMTVDRETYKH